MSLTRMNISFVSEISTYLLLCYICFVNEDRVGLERKVGWNGVMFASCFGMKRELMGLGGIGLSTLTSCIQ